MSRLPESPQLEHGHTRIANALLEALMKAALGGGELRALLAVVRLTYGWRKKQAPITARQVARATGLSLRHAKRTLGALIDAGILLRERSGRRNVLGLNKHFWEWKLCTTSAHGDTNGTSQGTPPSPVEGTDLSPLKNKEKKDIVVKKAPCGVQKFLEEALHRLLTPEERRTVTRLQSLDPAELNGLSQQMCKSRVPAL
ncbi:MAG: replication protein [Candidatus Omnitrophota bacterium]|nr:replication protein [Candidatus Omnitrophota bacterium]